MLLLFSLVPTDQFIDGIHISPSAADNNVTVASTSAELSRNFAARLQAHFCAPGHANVANARSNDDPRDCESVYALVDSYKNEKQKRIEWKNKC